MKLRWPNQRRRTAGLLAIIRFGALPIGLVSQGLAGRLLGLGEAVATEGKECGEERCGAEIHRRLWERQWDSEGE